ncbi:hypothetical protein C1701_00785 [Actinoalloteichus sp. AHMU CJ021]|nr:hypothetical protein C1701_00785 [Actinoalloteichus sp. AHMU CJ021]
MTDPPEGPSTVDLLVVGSGPVGATVARRVRDLVPGASVLVVDAGPAVTGPPGRNVHNLPAADRAEPRHRSAGRYPAVGAGAVTPRFGTGLLRPADPEGDEQDGMPAAALSTCVGGMGGHWTCATPRPGPAERSPFVGSDDLAVAERLLGVRARPYADTAAGTRLLAGLRDALPGQDVGWMPMAGGPGEWGGVDTVLGDLDRQPGFLLRPETLCRRLLLDDGRVVGAELECLRGGRRWVVRSRAVAVAADAFRGPQLLWASGLRPPALGRYLNDHLAVMAWALLDLDDPPRHPEPAEPFDGEWRDLVTGVLRVPWTSGHPFHGQVMLADLGPLGPGVADPRPLLSLTWYAAKEIRARDRVTFSAERLDAYGMPAPRVEYGLTRADRATAARAAELVSTVAASLGEATPGGEPRLLPAGSSLHYQGTVRMGHDPRTSVCDRDGRVWGVDNLVVGGNGVIGWPTAANPTLTSAALAVRSAAAVARMIQGV